MSAMCLALTASVAFAADGETALDTGDTAWVLISAALVFLMTPGPGVFLWRYGQKQKRTQYDYAQFLHCCDDFCGMGHFRLCYDVWQ